VHWLIGADDTPIIDETYVFRHDRAVRLLEDRRTSGECSTLALRGRSSHGKQNASAATGTATISVLGGLLGICFLRGVPEDVVEEIGEGEKGGWDGGSKIDAGGIQIQLPLGGDGFLPSSAGGPSSHGVHWFV
jgi:hypothetical protein